MYLPPPEVRLTAKGKKPKGRPPVKGSKIDTPQQAVAKAKNRKRLVVAWYGSGQRKVEVVTGTGHWYRAAQRLVELRWV